MSVSLSSALGIAVSGLQAAQTGLNAVSNNISNVNTPGYVRELVDQSSVSNAGAGGGVSIDEITRAVNQFLEAANLSATSDSGQAAIVSSTLDQAQSLFGDPTSSTSFFGQLDSVFSAFSTLSQTPSSAGQQAAVSQVSQFLQSGQSINQSLQGLVTQSDQQIGADVTTVNSLLQQIGKLNTSISQAKVNGSDVTGAQNQQSALVNQLTALVGVNVAQNATGGVTIRAADGSPLVQDQDAASFSYSVNGGSGQLLVTPVGGVQQPAGSRVASGEISGLLTLRNTDLPTIVSQVSNLLGATANQLNAVSNSYSAQPPPATLTGRNTGLDLATDVAGFTGKTSVAVLNSSGVVQAQVGIDFSAGTISLNGETPVSFTPSTFLSTLNSQLGAAGTASFNNGALSISASGGGNGVAISDDATAPSLKAGQGFSQFFGLNDLVTSSSNTDFATGLTSASASGYPAGQSITFALTGVGRFAAEERHRHHAARRHGGRRGQRPEQPRQRGRAVRLLRPGRQRPARLSRLRAGRGVSLAVLNDSTANTATGTSLSQLFGIGDATRAAAQSTLAVRADITADPTRLQGATVDLSGGVGSTALSLVDNSGAAAFAAAGQTSIPISASLGLAATTSTLSNYAAAISQAIASTASSAATQATTASAVSSEAQTRLSSTEGVNIDQELVSLTTYQQAYSASARIVQAVSDLFTTLIGITGQ